jgi:quercetin dioxygenase-like cupin family protein
MIPATPSGAVGSEQPDRRVDAPFISFDVPLEVARLRAERAYELEGHAGHTLTKYADLRVVLEAMKGGTRLRLHETAESMTLQVVLGRLRVWTEHGDPYDLAAGSFAAIDAARVHELECLDEGAFLLTLAWPPAPRRAAGGDGRDVVYGGGM